MIGAVAVGAALAAAGAASGAQVSTCTVVKNPTASSHTTCRNRDLRRINLQGRDLRHADTGHELDG